MPALSIRRRAVGQLAALALLVGMMWLVLSTGDNRTTAGQLGSDRWRPAVDDVAIGRLLDGVVVGAEGPGAIGPMAGLDRPPSAPAVGRSDGGSSSTTDDRRSSGDAPDPTAAPPVPASETNPGTGAGESTTTGPGSTSSSVATTAGQGSTTEPVVTTGDVTTTTGPTSTSEPVITTAEVTTTVGSSTTSASCVLVVTMAADLRERPSYQSSVVGQVGPGTFPVLEHVPGMWYRIDGGWLQRSHHNTPEGC